MLYIAYAIDSSPLYSAIITDVLKNFSTYKSYLRTFLYIKYSFFTILSKEKFFLT